MPVCRSPRFVLGRKLHSVSIPLARFSRGIAIGFSAVVLAVTLVGCGDDDKSKGNFADEAETRGLSNTTLPCDALSPATLSLLSARGPMAKLNEGEQPGKSECIWGSVSNGNIVSAHVFKTPELAADSSLLRRGSAVRPVEGVTWADETYFYVGASGKHCSITARSGKVILGVSYQPDTFDEMACQRQALAIAAEYAERNLKPTEG